MAAPHETTREKIPRKIVHRKVRHRRRAVPVEAPAEVAALPPPVPAIRPVGPAGVAGLLGKKVIGTGNEDLGRVVDVLVNDQGELRAAVIDFGGFLGVGNRKIAVDWALLQFHLRDSAGAVTLHLSRKQIQQAPEYKEGAHPDAVLLTREPADSVVPLVDPKAAQSAPSSSSTSSTSNNAGPPNRPAPLEAVHSHAPPVAK